MQVALGKPLRLVMLATYAPLLRKHRMNSSISTSLGGPTSLTGKYLTFRTGNEEFGVGILRVQEIIGMGMMKVTRVPRVPHFIRGVINLRGKVIPIIDLRLRFGLDGQDDTARTCVVVVQVSTTEGSTVTMGIIVDEVSEVLDIPGQSIEPPPRFGNRVETEYLHGIGKVGSKVIMLMDLDRVLDAGQMVEVQTAAN
jgi:purine-binding chemotaxis protein CheW